MPEPTDPMKEYVGAVIREHQAWEALQRRPPGTRRFSRTLWAAWVDSVQVVKLEAELYLRAADRTDPELQRGRFDAVVRKNLSAVKLPNAVW